MGQNTLAYFGEASETTKTFCGVGRRTKSTSAAATLVNLEKNETGASQSGNGKRFLLHMSRFSSYSPRKIERGGEKGEVREGEI